MGDVVSLVERAAETIDAAQGRRRSPTRCGKGKFDLDDLSDQLAQVESMGGMGGLMGMMPGMGKMKAQIGEAGLGDGMVKRQRAIISSMTHGRARATPTS